MLKGVGCWGTSLVKEGGQENEKQRKIRRGVLDAVAQDQ
jgi:hypothetical protein